MSSRNTLRLLGLASALNLLAPSSAIAEPRDAQIIVVHGDGQVRVAPDSLRIDVGVEVRTTTLEQARTQIATAMAALVAALDALQIPNLAVETKVLQINPIYGPRHEDHPSQIIGYAASNHAEVTVRDASVAELGERGSRALDAALTAGANSVGGLDFFLSDPVASEQAALADAVRDAQRDAETIAATAGVTLDGLYSVEEASGLRVIPRALAPKAVLATPIEVEDILVQASVTARYAFH